MIGRSISMSHVHPYIITFSSFREFASSVRICAGGWVYWHGMVAWIANKSLNELEH